MDYDLACQRATTDQGLDPVIAALAAAGLPHGLEQTGGFTMVVTAPVPTGTFAIIASNVSEGLYMLGHYPGTSWTDGPDEAAEYGNDLSIPDLVAHIQGAQLK